MTVIAGVLLALLALRPGPRPSAVQLPARQTAATWILPLGLREAPASHPVSMSADGRRIAFHAVTALVDADRNAAGDVYLLDVDRQQLVLVSATARGRAGNWTSAAPRISADGHRVAFESIATDLVDGTPDGCPTVFVYDVASRRLSAIARVPGSDLIVCARAPSINDDGTSVAFESTADVLSRGVTRRHVYVARPNGEIRLVPMPASMHPVSAVFSPSLSGDGRRVAYTVSSCAPAGGPKSERASGARTICRTRVHVFDWVTSRARILPDTSLDDVVSHSPIISRDGRWVAYVTGDESGPRGRRPQQVRLTDLERGTTIEVSHDRRRRPGNDHSTAPAISGNGRFVVFDSLATNLLCGRRCRAHEEDLNLVSDVFVWDRHSSVVSRLSDGGANRHWWWPSTQATVAMDAPLVAFLSRQPAPSTADDTAFNLMVTPVR